MFSFSEVIFRLKLPWIKFGLSLLLLLIAFKFLNQFFQNFELVIVRNLLLKYIFPQFLHIHHSFLYSFTFSNFRNWINFSLIFLDLC